jgi:two-component system, sensor histidine kinase RpfC
MIEALRRRFAKRSDTEHQQALIRVVIMGVIVAYLAAARAPDTRLLEFDGAFVAGLWFLTAFPILLWIALRPGISHIRRLIGMVGDFGALSIVLLLDGEASTPLFLMYLWVALGNGFRYGLRALLLATAISSSFFAVVLYFSPFWRGLPELSVGLLLCLIAIPLYAASLIKQLTEAKEQADRANRAKSRFLAVMSHELRTPLNAIIGANDVLRGMRMDSEQAEMTRTIGQAGRSLLSLIEDVLDLSRIEAGKERIERVAFDLYADLAETVSMLQIQARRKGLQLTMQVAAEVPDHVVGGRQQIRQILFNLIANAIKFTNTGSVRLRVRTTQTGTTAFDVIDTGVGIEQEHLARIFDSFTQVDEGVGRRHDGAGLGLAIVKQLTELMQGTVAVQSVPGNGSIFTVELRLPSASGTASAADEGVLTVVSRDPAVASAFADGGARVGTVSDVAALRVLLQQAERRDSRIIYDDRSLFRIAPFPADLLRGTDRVLGLVEGAFSSVSADLDGVCTARLGWPASPEAIGRSLRLLTPLATGDEGPAFEELEDSAETSAVADETTAAEPRSLARTRVLVAEDNPVNCRVIEKILRRGGFEPTIVNNGDDALDQLEAESFDLFIVDVNMPGTSGIDVVKLYAIQQLGQKRVPIVALTADTTPDTQRRCIEAGVDSFLPKPIEADRLLRTLNGLLEATGKESGLGTRDGRVTDITLHPRFQGSGDQVIDCETLRELSELDADPSFLDEIVGIYVADSEMLLDQIEDAVRHRDYAEFRDLLHALRSASANVGAQQLHAVCAQLSGRTRGDFQTKASEYFARLSHEFTRYRVEVQAWLKRGTESGHAN